MKIIEKIRERKPAYLNVAFLGDSVTQGCFEVYQTGEKDLDTVYDYKSAYSTRFREIMNLLYPDLRVNIINAGISGDKSETGNARVGKDVLAYHPDLVVVSYGLNDAAHYRNDVEAGLAAYEKNLRGIFGQIRDAGAQALFITQNYMNTRTSPHLPENDLFAGLAERFAKLQNDGTMKRYFDTAKRTAEESGVEILDLFAVWEVMERSGVNTTELLANKLNHPIREYHTYMAIRLVEKIFGI